METVKVKLAELNEDSINPRLHDAYNIGIIKKSLTKYNQYKPLVVQIKNMKVIVGNGRFRAMKELGWVEVDCVLLDITDAEADLLKISDNRTAELAEWDYERLNENLIGLADDLAEFTGFSEEYIDAIKNVDLDTEVTKKQKKLKTCPYCGFEFE